MTWARYSPSFFEHTSGDQVYAIHGGKWEALKKFGPGYWQIIGQPKTAKAAKKLCDEFIVGVSKNRFAPSE